MVSAPTAKPERSRMHVGVGVPDDPPSKPEPTSALTGSSYYICRGGYQPPANAANKTNAGYIRGTSPAPTAKPERSRMHIGVGVPDDPLSKPEPGSVWTGSSYYICRGGYQPPANAAIKTNAGCIHTRRADGIRPYGQNQGNPAPAARLSRNPFRLSPGSSPV